MALLTITKNKMKKLVLIGAVAVLGLSSCKKDHTCTCTVGEVDVETTINSKKSVALAYCEQEGYEIVEVKVGGEKVDFEEDNDTKCTLD